MNPRHVIALVAALALAALGPTPAGADEWPPRWTAMDVVLQGTFLTSLAIDWNQSRQGAERLCWGRPCGTEGNLVLGPTPSPSAVDRYFIGSALLHSAVAWLLPQPYRTIWQAAGIGVEFACVGANYRAGLGFRF